MKRSDCIRQQIAQTEHDLRAIENQVQKSKRSKDSRGWVKDASDHITGKQKRLAILRAELKAELRAEAVTLSMAFVTHARALLDPATFENIRAAAERSAHA